MLKILTQLFRKPSRQVDETSPFGSEVFGSETAVIMPAVETAPLSLLAILHKLPEDLQAMVAQWPDEETTIVLPMTTILKQLPNGVVKMSLASVQRQSPPGVMRSGNREDKRLVDVPLAEVLKRIRPDAIRRRPDQRPYVPPVETFDLFGDDSNPYAIAPRVTEEESSVLEIDENNGACLPPGANRAGVVAAPVGLAASLAAAPVPESKFAQALRARRKSDSPPLLVPVAALSGNWPEPIKSEVAAMNGAQVALPTDDITAGLAKGRVTFMWGELRAWADMPTGPTAGDEDLELVLPLRVVAPAFLKHSKRPAPAQQAVTIDETIPALFHGGEDGQAVPEPKPATLETAPVPALEEPVAQVVSITEETVVAPPAVSPELNVELAGEEAPVTAEEPIAEKAPEPTEEKTSEPVEEKVSEPIAKELTEPIIQEVAIEPVASAPRTLGEYFGQPGKLEWSPHEIVQHLAQLPPVSGAVVALMEGLVVAHALPEGVKGDIFAAFLPQIFARLNQYSGEMTLGPVDDVLIHTHGAPCQMFRRGEVFFAVLGKPGVTLPDHALRLCAGELAK